MPAAESGDGVVKDTEADDKLQKHLDGLHQVVGEVALFMGSRAAHRYMFLSDLGWMLLPPLTLRQYKVIRNSKSETIGYVSWALVSAEVETRLLTGEARLMPKEWKSGDKAVVIHLACPPGSDDQVLGRIKDEVFPDGALHVISKGDDGKPCLKEIEASGAQDGSEGGQ